MDGEHVCGREGFELDHGALYTGLCVSNVFLVLPRQADTANGTVAEAGLVTCRLESGHGTHVLGTVSCMTAMICNG